MRKTSIAIILLSIALVASNAWWLYNTIDFGITHTYAMQSCDENSRALGQMLSILPVAVGPESSRHSVIAAARVNGDEVVFEKEGFTWVGGLALRFDTNGKLLNVKNEP